jgi:hypothetical protein
MSNAPHDANFIKGKLGVLNTDGVTTVPIAIDEITGAMMTDDTSTISFTMTPISPQDENYQNCLLFVGTDGLTYPWVVNSSGEVLIDN